MCLSDTIIKKNGGTERAAPPGYWRATGSGGRAERKSAVIFQTKPQELLYWTFSSGYACHHHMQMGQLCK